jgi:hypothetical protein
MKTSAHSQLNTPLLRSRLKLKHLQSENLLREHHPQAVAMLEAAGVRPGSIRTHAAKLLAAGATATTLMFSPSQSLPVGAALPKFTHNSPMFLSDRRSQLVSLLQGILSPLPRPLTATEEEHVSLLFHELYGIHATAELEGNHLNTSYGLIGAEQHLPRFSGDTAWQHDAFPQQGITPGKSAWGYFAPSKAQLTPDLISKEKYYVAVQTLYLPDWQTRLSYLRDWYKYRKVIVANPRTGRAVVAVVADSGPAYWTGKHFGGSPEVMNYLESKDGGQKGPVILFFVDDPEDKVPLGPLEYNLEQSPLLLAAQ